MNLMRSSFLKLKKITFSRPCEQAYPPQARTNLPKTPRKKEFTRAFPGDKSRLKKLCKQDYLLGTCAILAAAAQIGKEQSAHSENRRISGRLWNKSKTYPKSVVAYREIVVVHSADIVNKGACCRKIRSRKCSLICDVVPRYKMELRIPVESKQVGIEFKAQAAIDNSVIIHSAVESNHRAARRSVFNHYGPGFPINAFRLQYGNVVSGAFCNP